MLVFTVLRNVKDKAILCLITHQTIVACGEVDV
jgi:hypothetical protein